MDAIRARAGGKGQSAVEYMMTYGWAILILLGLGVVLWRMGILSIGQDTTPGERGFSQVTPLDWRCLKSGSVQITVTNEAGVILNLTAANATITSGGSGACTGTVTGVPITVFRPAQSTTITFNGCPITDNVGNYFRAEIGIVFANPSSGIEHLSYGKVWGPIE
ncbi:MAG: hypothetical protein PHG85_05715 [Candidatus Altiarchaeota archaeon]|nr:hypothetical protein [Candidatus Altiarchaeota archaeon]